MKLFLGAFLFMLPFLSIVVVSFIIGGWKVGLTALVGFLLVIGMAIGACLIEDS